MKEVVSALCGMCCEPLASAEGGDGGGGDGGDGDSGGISPASAAAQALDCLACFCPAQHIHPQVWGSVWDKCRRSVDTWPSTAPCSTLTRRCAVSPATAQHIVGVIKYWDDRSRPTDPPHPQMQVLAFARQSCASADANARHGALNALAVIAEGCSEALRKRCGEVLPMVLRGLAVSVGRGEGKHGGRRAGEPLTRT